MLKLTLAGTIGWGIISMVGLPKPAIVNAREAKPIEFTWDAIEAKTQQVEQVRTVTHGFAFNMPERVWTGQWLTK